MIARYRQLYELYERDKMQLWMIGITDTDMIYRLATKTYKQKVKARNQRLFFDFISKRPYWALWYCSCNNKPWADGEKAIASNTNCAYLYARDILRGPFPMGEEMILKNSTITVNYTLYILKKPWPLGEDVIAMDAMSSYFYARDVIRGRFPLGEPMIAKSHWALIYTDRIIKGPWALGEPMIATNIDDAITYSIYIIKRRWLPAEQLLRKNYYVSRQREYENAFNIKL